MSLSTSVLILVACALNLVYAGPLELRAVSPDNTCGKTGSGGNAADGYMCPAALPCCSVNGFCGSTSAYCLTSSGCQGAFGNCTATVSPDTITPDETCGLTGAGTNGYKCDVDKPCCSANGWCGSTSDYCAPASGCQSDFGTCTASTSTPPTTPPGGGTSTNGQCGPNLGTCASNECCSLAGYCGTTEDYCTAPDCQFNYGPACDANQIPSGTNTSSIPRPKLGGVLYGSDGIYDCVNAGDMALTFDDGPAIYTSHILDLFTKYNAKATFFITGNNNAKGQIDNTSLAWPGIIKQMYAAGHQVASHTWSHPDLCNLTSAQRKNEMYKNEMALRNILGVFPTYMRPPYSSCTAACGCEADLDDLGYHITYFDLDTQDYLNDSPTLIQNSINIFDSSVAGKSASTDDFLVIGHDIHNQTSAVLVEHMLQTLQGQGYRAVTVGECLGDPQENWYRSDPSYTIGT